MNRRDFIVVVMIDTKAADTKQSAGERDYTIFVFAEWVKA